MPALTQTVYLPQKVVTDLSKWYAAVPTPFRQVDRRVLRKAAKLCQENWTKCTVEPDGSVIVWNRPVW